MVRVLCLGEGISRENPVFCRRLTIDICVLCLGEGISRKNPVFCRRLTINICGSCLVSSRKNPVF